MRTHSLAYFAHSYVMMASAGMNGKYFACYSWRAANDRRSFYFGYVNRGEQRCGSVTSPGEKVDIVEFSSPRPFSF